MRLRASIVAAVTLLSSCHAMRDAQGPTSEPQRKITFVGQKVRSFSDTFAVTAIADSSSTLWVGSSHGLVRWDVAAGKYAVVTTRDGLPADRISAIALDGQSNPWVATPKGVARAAARGWQSLPPPPVGEFLTGLQPSLDGRVAWAGGPEGLARWRGKSWERFLTDVGVTALAMTPNGVIWVGTSGRGVLRIPRSGDRVEAYGAPQGCEVDVVRGLAASDRGLFVIGDGPGGARAAYFDGERFYSYSVDAPQVIEWAARAGAKTLIGAGDSVYELLPIDFPKDAKEPLPQGPVKLTATTEGMVKAPRTVALKPMLASTALDGGVDRSPELPASRPPHFDTALSQFHVRGGATAIAGSERGLLVGTRFLGAERIENGVVRTFRTDDLSDGAERLTVACTTPAAVASREAGGAPSGGGDDCYLATGGQRAWRFDGQAFEPAIVDPEPGSRVLAVLRDPKGAVLAIHRGAKSSALRMSNADGEGHFIPVSMQEVSVPNGSPLLNFAQFAPDGHLWVGLRYVDKDNDPVDWGAAEVQLDSGRVIYHREGPLDGKTTFGAALPTDMVAIYFRSPHEAWFATRSGAARLLDGKVKVFTENEGLASELVYDIDGGPGNEVWVATGRGTGRWDGSRWSFPRLGAFYHKASSLAADGRGHNFIGTDKGLFCVGDCDPDGIDQKRGLLDDAVLDINVDPRGRVWVLTGKGLSIVEP